jgi:PAS domain S-box-containing protein
MSSHEHPDDAERVTRNSQPVTPRLIVVAEDDEGVNRIVCKQLERHGLKAVGVFSGTDAIAAVKQHPGCLLLLDYLLPDVNARQVLDELTKVDLHVPFIVMTGHGDEQIAVELMKLGARDYLVKRVDFTDLLVPVVERVLGQLATEEQLAASEQALRESEDVYRTLAKSIPGLVYRCDLKQGGTMRFMNDLLMPMTGYRADELHAGKVCSIEPLIIEPDRAGVVAEVERAIAEDRPFTVEYRLKRKDGSERFFNERGRPVRDADGRPSHIDGVIFDVTESRQTEAALRESESLLARSQYVGRMGSWDWDIPGEKLVWSDELYRLYGVDKDFQLTYENILTKIHPEDIEHNNREVQRLLAAGTSHSFEFRIARADGEVRAISQHIEVTRGPDGKPVRAFGIMQDITERKQSEEAARVAAQRWQKTFDGINDAVCILSPEGAILHCNATMGRLVGSDSAALVGKSCCHVVHGTGSPPDECPLVRARKTLARERSEIGLGDRTVEVTVDPLLDENGNLTGAVHIVADITERKLAEERDRQHLRDTALLRDTAVGFIQLAPDADVYQYVADRLSALVGEAYIVINSYDEGADEYTVRAIAGIGARLETVLKVMGRNPVGTVFAVANEHRIEYASEKLMKFEDGLRGLSYGKLPGILAQTIQKTFDIGGVYAMGFYWQGRVLGTLNLIMRRGADVRDPAAVEAFVSQAAIALQHRLDADELDRHRVHLEELVAERSRELTAAQGQLVLQEKLATLGRVAGSVAHELRNPLGVIRNASFFLQSTVADQLEGKPRRHLQSIDESVQRANQAITMILDFTQGRTAEPDVHDLQPILKQSVDEANLPPTVEVLIAVPPSLPQVFVDAAQVEVVFRNLVTNAAQAMPDGGKVETRARAGQDEIVVDVTDNGVGIKPEHMASLFRPLFTTKDIGVGLGLAICKGFIEANRGTISVASEVGKGTTFTITLPVAKRGEPSIVSSPDVPASLASLEKGDK